MYDLNELKSIPLFEVAKKYNIHLEKKNGRYWGKLRDERTPSFSINVEKNLWYDFGSGKGGTTIDLVAEIENISSKEAITRLAELFNIENRVTHGWSPLTDSQYREIGIEPTLATMNFKYDLRVHTQQQLARWNSKYAVPLAVLAEKYPDDYNYLVNKIAGNYIKELRDLYFYKLRLAVFYSNDPSKKDLYMSWAELDAADINSKYELYTRALKGIKPDMDLSVNVKRDLKALESERNTDAVTYDTELIRSKIVYFYKSLFNFYQAEFLTPEQAKDLYELNLTISSEEGKYLNIQEIKDLHSNLGNKLNDLEQLYKTLVAERDNTFTDYIREEIDDKVYRLENNIKTVKELFNKCSTVLDGIRQANMLYKNHNQNLNKDNVPLHTYELDI